MILIKNKKVIGKIYKIKIDKPTEDSSFLRKACNKDREVQNDFLVGAIDITRLLKEDDSIVISPKVSSNKDPTGNHLEVTFFRPLHHHIKHYRQERRELIR